jgi:hypothetical protein
MSTTPGRTLAAGWGGVNRTAGSAGCPHASKAARSIAPATILLQREERRVVARVI